MRKKGGIFLVVGIFCFILTLLSVTVAKEWWPNAGNAIGGAIFVVGVLMFVEGTLRLTVTSEEIKRVKKMVMER